MTKRISIRFNRWVKRIEMRFVIDKEFLDKTSRRCGFYHYTGKLVRHGSDGNPIIWMNIGQSGITLWGKEAKLIAPGISDQCLNDALLLELNYLREGLASNVGDQTDKAFVYNAYAVLTACRILYSAPSQSAGYQISSLRLGNGNCAIHVGGDHSHR